MAGNSRKDFSIKPPVTSIIPGVLNVLDTPSIDLNYSPQTQTLSAVLTTLINGGTYGSSTQVPVFTVDSQGRITAITQVAIAGGGGGITTADNGLTLSTATNVQWGGTLLQNTTINGGTYLTSFTGNRTSPNPIVAIQNTGTGSGLSISTNYTTLRLTSNYSSLNTVEDNLQLIRTAPGLVASGIGQAIQFRNQSSSGSTITANKIISEITDVTPASFTSKMRLLASLNALDVDVLSLFGSGQIQGNKYGVGTFTGTPTYNLAVDASGNFIETAFGGSIAWGSITGTLTSQTDLISYLVANYYPLSSNPAGYLTTIAGLNISLLTNDSGYITSAALSPYVQSTRAVNTINSLTGGGDLSADRTLSLVNDSASPGNNKVYGTDSSGVKGWKADPTGGGNSIGELTSDVTAGPATLPSQSVPATLKANLKTGSFGVTIDGVTSIIQIGQVGYVVMPYAGTITGWSITANTIGNIQFDIWKTAAAIPLLANSIIGGGGNYPQLTSSQFVTSTTMTSWTLTFAAGDVFGFYVNPTPTVKNATLTLRCTKS